MRLFIGCPTYDGRIHAATVAGIAECCAAGAMFASESGADCATARNRLTERFMRSEATHMLQVDSDIGFRLADALELVARELDVASGTYVQKSSAKLQTWTASGAAEDGGLLPCAMVPGGFILIRKSVIRALRERFPEESPWGYRAERTEDVSFCRRCQDAGISVWLDPSVKLPHYDGNTAYRP